MRFILTLTSVAVLLISFVVVSVLHLVVNGIGLPDILNESYTAVISLFGMLQRISMYALMIGVIWDFFLGPLIGSRLRQYIGGGGEV